MSHPIDLHRMEDKNFQGHAAMLGAVLIFGLLSPISKALLTTGIINPYTLTLMRMSGAAVVFWIASLFVRTEHVSRRDRLLLFFASLLGIVLNQGAYIVGVSLTSPINASVITTTNPMFVMLIAAIYLHEPITAKKVIGVLTGATGALVLILSGAHRITGQASASLTGDLLCLGSQLCFASYFVLFKKLISRYKPITLMKWMFLYATACCLPFGLHDLEAVPWNTMPLSTILELAYIVLCATFIAYLLMPIGQKNLRPTVASSYNYAQPLVASMVAVFTGMDHFTPMKGFAIALIFTGVYLVTISRSRAQIEAQKALQAPPNNNPLP